MVLDESTRSGASDYPADSDFVFASSPLRHRAGVLAEDDYREHPPGQFWTRLLPFGCLQCLEARMALESALRSVLEFARAISRLI
jgi:hypothetical protein